MLSSSLHHDGIDLPAKCVFVLIYRITKQLTVRPLFILMSSCINTWQTLYAQNAIKTCDGVTRGPTSWDDWGLIPLAGLFFACHSLFLFLFVSCHLSLLSLSNIGIKCPQNIKQPKINSCNTFHIVSLSCSTKYSQESQEVKTLCLLYRFMFADQNNLIIVYIWYDTGVLAWHVISLFQGNLQIHQVHVGQDGQVRTYSQ